MHELVPVMMFREEKGIMHRNDIDANNPEGCVK